MWFGDLVTMRWWDDLWLNETFATYLSYRCLAAATRFTDAWQVFNGDMRPAAHRQDQLVTTHPVATRVEHTDQAVGNFDAITYEKGAAVIKQLVAALGDDTFRTGLQRYFDRHAWGNATLADFLEALGEAAGEPLDAWARLWLQTPSLNTIGVHWSEARGDIVDMEVRQEAPPEHPALRPHATTLGLVGQGLRGSSAGRPGASGPHQRRTADRGRGGRPPRTALRLPGPGRPRLRARPTRSAVAGLRARAAAGSPGPAPSAAGLVHALRDGPRGRASPRRLPRDGPALHAGRGGPGAAGVHPRARRRRAATLPAGGRRARRVTTGWWPWRWRRPCDTPLTCGSSGRGPPSPWPPTPADVDLLLDLVDAGWSADGVGVDQEMRWSLAVKAAAHGLEGASDRWPGRAAARSVRSRSARLHPCPGQPSRGGRQGRRVGAHQRRGLWLRLPDAGSHRRLPVGRTSASLLTPFREPFYAQRAGRSTPPATTPSRGSYAAAWCRTAGRSQRSSSACAPSARGLAEHEVLLQRHLDETADDLSRDIRVRSARGAPLAARPSGAARSAPRASRPTSARPRPRPLRAAERMARAAAGPPRSLAPGAPAGPASGAG